MAAVRGHFEVLAAEELAFEKLTGRGEGREREGSLGVALLGEHVETDEGLVGVQLPPRALPGEECGGSDEDGILVLRYARCSHECGGLERVGLHSPALQIELCQTHDSGRIPGIVRLLHPCRTLNVVLLHLQALEVHNCQAAHGGPIVGTGTSPEPAEGFIKVLLHSLAVEVHEAHCALRACVVSIGCLQIELCSVAVVLEILRLLREVHSLHYISSRHRRATLRLSLFLLLLPLLGLASRLRRLHDSCLQHWRRCVAAHPIQALPEILEGEPLLPACSPALDHQAIDLVRAEGRLVEKRSALGGNQSNDCLVGHAHAERHLSQREHFPEHDRSTPYVARL
mmetsp:Transcript_11374/g.46142  ORF Transcript_11374/g.46142 Transcript_11374/m.46142 type:complete len:341 (-) Transcript_11374:673-1695(-)